MLEHELSERVKKYRSLTERALFKVSLKEDLTEAEKDTANDFLSVAKNYFNDAKHFEEQGKLLLALAAYSYAHAWLDAGVRAKILNGKQDETLFTLP